MTLSRIKDPVLRSRLLWGIDTLHRSRHHPNIPSHRKSRGISIRVMSHRPPRLLIPELSPSNPHDTRAQRPERLPTHSAPSRGTIPNGSTCHLEQQQQQAQPSIALASHRAIHDPLRRHEQLHLRDPTVRSGKLRETPAPTRIKTCTPRIKKPTSGPRCRQRQTADNGVKDRQPLLHPRRDQPLHQRDSHAPPGILGLPPEPTTTGATGDGVG